MDPEITKAEQIKCTSGKACKNWKGLNIHLGNSKCQNIKQRIMDMIERPADLRERESREEQLTDDSGETEGNLSQEANHSAKDPHASRITWTGR